MPASTESISLKSGHSNLKIMGMMRDAFPILRDSVYLDVAYKASAPDPVRDGVGSYFDDNQSFAGDKILWAKRIEAIRSKAARLIGANADEIAFVKNASEGMNLLAHSIDYRQGDNAVISDQEHAANLYPWTNLAGLGVEVRRVKSRDYAFGAGDVIALVDDRTRVVSLSLVCQVSGFIPDVAAIAEFCRPKNIRVFVDAMQAVGSIRVRVGDLGVDGLATSGHKWLLGPYGTGFLYAKREFARSASPVFASKHYSRLQLQNPNTALLDDAGKWEYGSLNYPGLFGLDAGLDMILTLGDDVITSQTAVLVNSLRELANREGLRAITPANGTRGCSGILSFACNQADAVAKKLRERNIYVSSRGGVIRTSLHFYNNSDDLRGFIDAMSKASGVAC